MTKSANQLWRESGTTLSFKEGISREKEKYANADGERMLIPNIPLQDTVQRAIDEVKKDAGFKTESSNKTVLGINKTVLIVAGVLIAGAIAYKIYQNQKSSIWQ